MKMYFGEHKTAFEGQYKTAPRESGVSIEQKLREAAERNEPIEDGFGEMFSPEYDPGMDIRTDRWEYMQQAFDKKSDYEGRAKKKKDGADQKKQEPEETKEHEVEGEE